MFNNDTMFVLIIITISMIVLSTTSTTNQVLCAPAFFVRSSSSSSSSSSVYDDDGDDVFVSATTEDRKKREMFRFQRTRDFEIVREFVARLTNAAMDDDDDDDRMREVSVLLDSSAFTLREYDIVRELAAEGQKKEHQEEEYFFVPRFTRSDPRVGKNKKKNSSIKDMIGDNVSEEVRARVKYWNCEEGTRESDDEAVDANDKVREILGDSTMKSSSEDRNPNDRVGIVLCGSDDAKEDAELFLLLVKTLREADRSFFAGILGGEVLTLENDISSTNSGCKKSDNDDDLLLSLNNNEGGEEEKKKGRELLFSKGAGSQVNECDAMCELHVTIVSCLIIFWIFAGTFTYGIGMMSNLDTPKIFEKSDE
jgi:hypothetical protein